LTGVAVVLAIQFQNGALARYPDAVRELAVFALASSTLAVFQAGLAFASQLSNVFARSAGGTRRCHRFISLVSLGLSLPVVGLVALPAGQALIQSLYGIDLAILELVIKYLWLMTPLFFVTAQRMHYSGLLVQSKLTGWVTALHTLFLFSNVGGLILGFLLSWRAVHTIVGAQAVAGLVHWAALVVVYRRYYRLPAEPEHEDVSYSELLRFFLPVALTGTMFALSRPVLFAFVARSPDGLASIAAMRVGFDFSMIFQQAANQFRHFFVTFGLDDLRMKRRFMTAVCVGLTLTMLVIALTPLSSWVLSDLIGIQGTVLERSVDVILIMCLLPTIITVRNYFHGHLMVRRRTGGMAYGAVLRVLGIYAAAHGLYVFGVLDYIAASFVLLLGFVIETAVVAAAVVWLESGGVRFRS